MDDLNYLHDAYRENNSIERDELEEVGLNPKIVIVEDDKRLGLSIKAYLMKTL